MKSFLLWSAIVLTVAVPVSAQLVTLGTGTTMNTNTSEPAPYGNFWWGSRHQMIIQASELTAQGVAAGAVMNSVAFDVVTVLGQPLVNFEIKAGLTTSPDLSGGWIAGTASALAPIASYQPVVGWNTHVLSTPVVWDGTSNLVIETCHNNASYTLNCIFNQSATTFTSTRWYRNDATGICVNPATTGAVMQRPNMQFTFSGSALPPEYQVNQAGSSMAFNGATDTAYAHSVASVCSGGAVSTDFASNLLGSGWDVALTFLPAVAASAGGITLSDGQVVNLNLGAGLLWLNGGLAPALLPMPGMFSVPFAAPGAGFVVTAQSLVIDPSSPTMIRLSQAAELNVVGVGSQLLAMGDDTNTMINLGGGPLCTPASLNFYGTAYNQVNMLSNGRMMFGAANNGWTPSAVGMTTSAGSFGIWCDLYAPAGGTITVAGVLGGGIRLDFAGINYFTAGPPVTFGLQLDSAGVAQIDGLAGVAVHAAQQLVGISGGFPTLATATAPVAFSPASAVPVAGPATPADVIYAIGTAGSLTTGLSTIVFMPNAGGNYDWMSL